MKKTLFVLLIVIGAAKLQAQQLTFKPLDSALFKNALPHLKPGDSSVSGNYFPALKPGEALTLNIPKQGNNIDIVYSTMPVVKTRSNDRMPIVKPGDSNMKYTMLVKKVKVINPLEKQFVLNP
ncbi:MAG: hypothetical protein JST32_09200 [Bacteroidetes bacterium]|nr:hypothetical protein [Bacteroidota bacterium]